MTACKEYRIKCKGMVSVVAEWFTKEPRLSLGGLGFESCAGSLNLIMDGFFLRV